MRVRACSSEELLLKWMKNFAQQNYLLIFDNDLFFPRLFVVAAAFSVGLIHMRAVMQLKRFEWFSLDIKSVQCGLPKYQIVGHSTNGRQLAGMYRYECLTSTETAWNGVMTQKLTCYRTLSFRFRCNFMARHVFRCIFITLAVALHGTMGSWPDDGGDEVFGSCTSRDWFLGCVSIARNVPQAPFGITSSSRMNLPRAVPRCPKLSQAHNTQI